LAVRITIAFDVSPEDGDAGPGPTEVGHEIIDTLNDLRFILNGAEFTIDGGEVVGTGEYVRLPAGPGIPKAYWS
jgi:hypothetical protein